MLGNNPVLKNTQEDSKTEKQETVSVERDKQSKKVR